MNNVNKSEGDNSDFIGVNRSVLSPLPKLGTMGSNWGEVRVTGFLYHLIQWIEKNAREIETIFDADGLEIRKCSY